MVGFIALETAFGLWLVGFIMGFASSIGLAAYIVHRARRKYESGGFQSSDIRADTPSANRTRH